MVNKCKIIENTMSKKRELEVVEEGVRIYEFGLVDDTRLVPFDKVSSVLMSKKKNVLSFQVGDEVISFKTDPENICHQMAIAALVNGISTALSEPVAL